MNYKSNLPSKSNKQFNHLETPSNGPKTGNPNASFIFNSDLSQIGENSNEKNISKEKKPETFYKNAAKFLVNDDAKSINFAGNIEDKSNLGDASFMSAVCGHAFEGLLRLNKNQDSNSKSCLLEERADLESMG
jgi:hypothetical protein